MWEEMTKNEPPKGNPSFPLELDYCTDDNIKTDEEEDFQNLLMLACGRYPDLLIQLQQAAEVVMFPKHPPIDVPELLTVTEDSNSVAVSSSIIIGKEVEEEEEDMTEEELLMTYQPTSPNAVQTKQSSSILFAPTTTAATSSSSTTILPAAATTTTSTTTPVTLLEEIYKLRHELNTLRKEMTLAFSSMDFKRVRKNRTMKNRCSFVNRRGEGCRGYKCRIPGSTLCYAHHILSAASCYPDRRAKLY
jgi:hypothetical protein